MSTAKIYNAASMELNHPHSFHIPILKRKLHSVFSQESLLFETDFQIDASMNATILTS